MKRKTDLFRELHKGPDPLLIGNVWNVQSAKSFEKAGIKAIATSSAAVAETLGYIDGEAMPFGDYFFTIKRIATSTTLPLSVDLEGGYGRDASRIVDNIATLSEAGVSGVNIEDSLVIDGTRTIQPYQQFASLIESVCDHLKKRGIDMFINLRSDTFLLPIQNALEESIRRINAYQTTGADGLFFPGVTAAGDIRMLTTHSSLPVNVMCMPSLPAFDELKSLGVKRISMGNFYNRKIYAGLEKLVMKTADSRSFKVVFE